MFRPQLLSPGFLAILLHKEYGEDAEKCEDGVGDEEERAIPEFDEGETIPLMRLDSSSSKVTVAPGVSCWATFAVKEKMTTTPSHLTESELMTLMEKHGIGKLECFAQHSGALCSLLTNRMCGYSRHRRLYIYAYRKYLEAELLYSRDRKEIAAF
jgi:DNA topoisomerase IA